MKIKLRVSRRLIGFSVMVSLTTAVIVTVRVVNSSFQPSIGIFVAVVVSAIVHKK